MKGTFVLLPSLLQDHKAEDHKAGPSYEALCSTSRWHEQNGMVRSPRLAHVVPDSGSARECQLSSSSTSCAFDAGSPCEAKLSAYSRDIFGVVARRL